MSKIEWTDVTVSPFPGCKKVSPGCEHCYAERMARRQKAMGRPAYQNVVDEHGWTGKVGCQLEQMRVPGTGKMVFVNSMGDLAYDGVTFPAFCSVMGDVMLQPWHTFQFLTKRPGEMASRIERIIRIGTKERYLDPLMLMADAVGDTFSNAEIAKANDWYKVHVDQAGRGICDLPVPWPLRNLWMGATCEDQAWHDRRSSELVEARAVVHFLSLEPLLGPIRLTWPKAKWTTSGWFARKESLGIDWVIVGPETGPGRRSCNIDWIASIVEQCHAAEIPVFVKAVSHGGEIVKDIAGISARLDMPVERWRQWPKCAGETADVTIERMNRAPRSQVVLDALRAAAEAFGEDDESTENR